MIEQIEISNIQAHKYSHLTLSDKLNIIKGRTHSGKSCIIRALKWAIENRPKGGGDKLKNDQAKKDDAVSVSVLFSDGKFISREKTRKNNSYISSEHKDPFDAIKLDVPDEIREIIKLTSNNIRSQGDGYFLIDKTGGQIATALNDVVGLKIIDETKLKAKKLVSSFTNRLQVLDSQIEEAELELKSPEFKVAERIGKLLSEYDYEDTFYSTIIDEIEEISNIYSKIKNNRSVVYSYNRMSQIEDKVKELEKLITNFEELEENISHILDIKSDIDKSAIYLERYNNISHIKPIISSINREIEAYFEIEQASSKIRRVYLDIKKNRSFIADAAEALESYENKLIELELELEKRLDYCDKCGAHRKHWNKKEVRDA